MKRAAIVFLSLTLFSACSILDVFKDKPIGERVQDAEILVIAAYQSIDADVTTNYITPDEAEIRLHDVQRFEVKIDRVKALLELGDVEKAELKLNAVNLLMVNIQSYTHRRALEAQ